MFSGRKEARTEGEKPHFMTTRVLVDSGKNHQWMFRSLGERLLGIRIIKQSHRIPHRFLINYKKNKIPLQWTGLVDTTLTP